MIGARVTAVTSGISANLVKRLGEFAYYFIGAYAIVVWIAHLLISRESKPAAVASKRETRIKAVDWGKSEVREV
jgi:bacteriorhodopsin